MTAPPPPQMWPGQWYQASDGMYYCWPDPRPYAHPPAAPAAHAPTAPPPRSSGPVVLFLGGALIALGSFLPWVTADVILGPSKVSGIDHGEGVVTLLLGAVIVAVAWSVMRGWDAPRTVVSMLMAPTVLVGVAALLALSSFSGADPDPWVEPRPGSGLFVIAAGAVLAVVGGIGTARARRTRVPHA